jgi:hypothetical protein
MTDIKEEEVKADAPVKKNEKAAVTPTPETPEAPEVETDEAPAKALPDTEQIDAWKEQYGKVDLVGVADDAFVYRRITRTEHKEMVKDNVFNSPDAQETIVRMFLLFPDIDTIDIEGSGGIIQTMSENILLASGFGNRMEPITL